MSLVISPSISRLTRHTGPLADDLGDVFRVDLFLQHAVAQLQLVEVLGGLVDAALELGDAAEADLGRDVEIGLALELGAQLLELLLQRADGVDRLLLVLPVRLHLVHLRVERGELVDDGVEPLLGGGVGLLLQRDLFDLELQDAALHDVDLGGQRVDLDAQLAGRFVHQVDGLVGQEAVGEVAVADSTAATTSAESWMRTPWCTS